MIYHTHAGTVLVAAIFLAMHTPPSAAATDVPAGSSHAFEQALASDYQALSNAESAAGDGRDAATYAARAAAASAGQPTAPDELKLRAAFLKDHYVDELSTAHDRLMNALAKTARNDAPAAAARAQTSFDCWLEQSAEDLQPDDIAACKQSFMTAMTTVESSTQPVADVAPPVAVAPMDSDGDGVIDPNDKCPGTPPGVKVNAEGCPEVGATLMSMQGVNFDTDSAKLKAESTTVLDQAVKVLNQQAVSVRIEGHADSRGSDAYNQSLSEKRAKSVTDYLVSKGVDADRLTSAGYGESKPVVANDSAAHMAKNRRVDLVVTHN